MSKFDTAWTSIPEVYSEKNEKIIYNQIVNARNIVFVAKGRVGLVTKMFMQRLIQLGHNCFWCEDLNIPMINGQDLVVFVSASGHTISSHVYVSIAKEVGARTLAITFNDTGRITLAVQTAVIYQEKKAYHAGELFEQLANPLHMKTYYELAFLYIFERLVSQFDSSEFKHTNFE
tara:strand:+ start:40 stop:564 length:525 start_codon:yes stop_codon:yes gene_type:complete